MWEGRWEIDYGNVDEIFEQRGLLYTELVAKMPCLFNKKSDHDDFESVDNLGRPGHGLPGNSYHRRRSFEHVRLVPPLDRVETIHESCMEFSFVLT